MTDAPKTKIIALEEHFVTEAIVQANQSLPMDLRDPSMKMSSPKMMELLLELGPARLQRMDEAGVDVAVLSHSTPATQSLPVHQAIELARQSNDLLGQVVFARPDRFMGFATLPTPDPQESVRELERCVNKYDFKGAMINGRTGDKNLDSPEFIPIFEAAVNLGVPIYLHPQGPVAAVQKAYYSGFDDTLNNFFAMGGFGWHIETGIQALRLILSGLFDRLPTLQIILGHWGETVTFYLERVDGMSKLAKHLQKPVASYFRENFYVTPAGLYSVPMFIHAMQTMGADRILYSTDDPFQPAPGGKARAFLENAPISPADIKNIGWENAAKLLKLAPAWDLGTL